MNEEYFIPQLEDFRIGYEFEYYDDDKDWTSVIVNDQSNLCYWTAFDNIQKRVAYLTKEQIETEGWNMEWNDGNDGIEEFTFSKDNWILTFSTGWKDKINPMQLNRGTAVYFRGECKSVNELRYITKLLKI